jgi:putative Holliday junction resolvase
VGRVLGVDLGERRVGVAVSDPLGITAQGRETMPRLGGLRDLEAIAALAREEDAQRIVIGLPLRLDGTAGVAAEEARKFAADLERVIDVPVDLWDERLTTAEVERAMTEAGVRRRKRRVQVDRLAAVLILQSWLDAQGSSST